MTNVVKIPPLETGVVRVFSVALEGDAATSFARDPAAQARALGLPAIEADYARVFPVSDIEGIGLSGYLTEGLGIDPRTLGEEARKIDALSGHVAVVTSKAFGDGGATLRVVPPLKLVGTFAEDRPPVTFAPLDSKAAHGTFGGPVALPAPPQRGGRLGFLIAVLVVVAGFIALAVLRGRP